MAAPENSGPEHAGPAAPGRGRPFKKGQSGNPGGRPKTVAALEAEIRSRNAPHVLGVLDKMRAVALDGDVQAAKLYLDRVMGPARPPAEHVAPVVVPEPGAPEPLPIADALLGRVLRLLGAQVAALEAKAAADGLTAPEVAALSELVRTAATVASGMHRFTEAEAKRLAALPDDELRAVAEREICNELGITLEQLQEMRRASPRADGPTA